MKDVVSHVTCEKVLKALSLEACIATTQEAVGTTRQVKLFTVVKVAWCYDIPLPRTQKLQTDRHTQNKCINIIEIITLLTLLIFKLAVGVSCTFAFMNLRCTFISATGIITKVSPTQNMLSY